MTKKEAQTADILIRDVPEETIKKIDKLADQQSRSRQGQLLTILEAAVKGTV